MPLPPPTPENDDDSPAPQSRLKSSPTASSRSSKIIEEFEASDDTRRASARRVGSDDSAPRVGQRFGSALNPIAVGAARQPASIARDGDLDERSDDIAPAEAFPQPIAPRVARLEPKPEPKPEIKPEPLAHSSTAAKTKTWEEAGASKRATSDGVLIAGQSASLAVETLGPKAITVGKEAVFTIRLRNSSESPANGVVVAIAVPGHVDVLSSHASNGNVQNPAAPAESTMLKWQIARVEPRAKETLTLKLVPRKSLPIELAMQWAAAPDASQTLVEVQEPQLTMSLSGPSEILYGQSKIYKINITNPGNGDAENVTVSLLPMGRSTDAAASRRLGTLRPGQSKTIEVELTARQSGMLSIKAEATADGGLEASAVEQVVVRRANLKAIVQAPRIKFAGTAATYSIVVGNAGNATAENVVLTTMLPAQAKYISGAVGGKVDAAQGKVVWNLGSLPAGAERAIEVHCVLQAAGENRLQVAATSSDEQVVQAAGITRVDAVADLKLEIRDPQGPVAVGDDAVYEVTVRNRGTKSAEGVDMLAFFTEGLEAVRVEGALHEIGRGQVAFKTLPSLAPGAELVIKIHAKAEASGNHVFRAEVACQSPMLKLSAEETTLFYGDESNGQGAAAAADPAATSATGP